MEEAKKPRRSTNWSRLLVLLCVLFAGVLIGQLLCLRYTSKNLAGLLSSDKTSLVLRAVQRQYVDSVSMPMLEGVAIRAILDKLDPHSVYIPASEASAATEPLEGGFLGVGLGYTIFRDSVVVVHVTPDGPSLRAGIMAGDRIVAVGDSLLTGPSNAAHRVSSLLRGKDGTKVKATIVRPINSKRFEVEIQRGVIPINSVDVSYLIEKNIGYIRLNKFSKYTDQEFVAAVKSLKREGMDRLILDLRDNTGGVMESAIRVCDHFLLPGTMVVYAQGRTRPRIEIRATDDTLCVGLPLVLLINENSASASEIVAGAMQDNDRATIIGRRSYGKGLIQEQITFRDGSLLRLTVARYYTPTGRSIQKPYVNGSKDYYTDLSNRVLHGEMTDADSMKRNDTLKFITPGGRILYGGGGIYPDIFIPADTILSSFYAESSGFGFVYVDTHRKELMLLKNVDELLRYLSTANMLKEFYLYVQKDSVPFQLRKSFSQEETTKMERVLTAYIIRRLFDDAAFFAFINTDDRTVLKAVEVLRGVFPFTNH